VGEPVACVIRNKETGGFSRGIRVGHGYRFWRFSKKNYGAKIPGYKDKLSEEQR
jgi:hypothetical protein